MLSVAYGVNRQPDEALTALAAALSAAQRTGERCYAAETCCLQRQVLLQTAARDPVSRVSPQDAVAAACWQRALAIARQQHSKSPELRAALSLACLWQQQSKRAEACTLLAAVYSWFTEGFDTVDLREAKTLLGELG